MSNNVVPFDPKERLAASLAPCGLTEAEAAVAVLATALAIMPSIQNPAGFKRIMADRLAEYPADIVMAAVKQATSYGGFDQMPSIPAMCGLCEALAQPRRDELHRLEFLENEKRRAAEERGLARQREADAERQRQAEIDRLRDVEERARERLGVAAPLPGDVALADCISSSVVRRCGRRIYWQDALADGEPWAAKFTRSMALAQRIRLAFVQGRIPWDRALGLAKKIPADEAAARAEVEQIEGSEPGRYYGHQLSGGFWRALWRIHHACGLDVRPGKLDPVAVAAGNVQHLQGLAALADVRAIIDQQAKTEWEQRYNRGRSAETATSEGVLPE